MPLYPYRCDDCGLEIEILEARSRPPEMVTCRNCGGPARRRYTPPAQLGRASVPKTPDAAPRTWEATLGGNRELITAWHRELAAHEALASRNPELAITRNPVRAHEHHHHLSASEAHHHTSAT